MNSLTGFVNVASLLVVLLGGCSAGASSSSSGTTGPGVPGNSSSLEGTWDIVSYASENLAPSFVAIVGGKLTGSLNYAGSDCTQTLEFAIQGDSMTGLSTPSQFCRGAQTKTLSGSRFSRQPDSETPWNGIWKIQAGTEEGSLTISGLSATADDFQLNVAGGLATAGGSREARFVARRR